MANSRFYSSTAAVTNLQVTAGPGDATIQVASSSGFPNSFPFVLCLDYGSANEELVDVTSGGPSIYNVTRAIDGTSASTHNAGAVVRHTSSARDFTDSRTHEASVTGVHGVSGSIVDTLSTQTLNNKTLNSPTINNATVTGTVTATGATVNNGTYGSPTLTTPTINGGSMSGTVSGAPTFSGNVTISGNPTISGTSTVSGQVNLSNLLRGSRGSATDSMYESRVTGDTGARWFERADGRLSWGPGDGTFDLTFERNSPGVASLVGGMTMSGGLSVGTGGISTTDITITQGTWTPYTVTWTASGGGNSIGNGSLVGRHRKLGKAVELQIMLTFGNTTNPGSGSYSFSLPFAAANLGVDTIGIVQYLGADRWAGQMVVTANATTTSPFFPTLFTSGALTGAATGKLAQQTATFPEPPGTGDKVRIAITYEAA